jgi:hypothetical protein
MNNNSITSPGEGKQYWITYMTTLRPNGYMHFFRIGAVNQIGSAYPIHSIPCICIDKALYTTAGASGIAFLADVLKDFYAGTLERPAGKDEKGLK